MGSERYIIGYLASTFTTGLDFLDQPLAITNWYDRDLLEYVPELASSGGVAWPGKDLDLDLVSKRKRWNWYQQHLMELRGDRPPAFTGIVPRGKQAARKTGPRAREQRTRVRR